MSLQPMFRRSVFWLLVFVTLSFGWWPYSFWAKNDVQYDSRVQALRFNERYEEGDSTSRGVVFCDELLDTRSWSGVSIAIELRGRPRKSGLGVFLEFFQDEDDGLPSLLVSQWQNHLALRSERNPSEVARGYSEIGGRDLFSSGEFVTLVFASEGLRTHVYANGRTVSTRSDFSLLGDDNRFFGRLAVGNSADGTKPFTGEIRSVRIFEGFLKPGSQAYASATPAVELIFSGENVAREWTGSEPYVVAKRRFLGPINAENFDKESYKSDIIVNALGFIPVGICFAAAARRRSNRLVSLLVMVGFASFCLSLFIELGQGYLVHRDSSWQDVLLNTFSGTVALAVPRRWILFL